MSIFDINYNRLKIFINETNLYQSIINKYLIMLQWFFKIKKLIFFAAFEIDLPHFKISYLKFSGNNWLNK